jgi:polyisoprenoid-binding protein YceI
MKQGVSLLVLWMFAWVLQAQQPEVSFVIKNFGIKVDGHFNRSNIDIKLGPEGQILDIKGVVYVNTIETGIESRDAHILKEDYFDALAHPEITLESTSVKVHDLHNYTIVANLTIKGKTQIISFSGALTEDNIGLKFKTDFEINRQDFDVGGGGVLGKTVKIFVTHYVKP